MNPAETKLEENSEFSVHFLTQVMHLASMNALPANPSGSWSSPENCTEELLGRFATMLSSQAGAPPKVLSWLSRFSDPRLQERVAEHANTPLETLEALAKSPHPDVRAALADNPKAPFELLFALSMDEHADVRYRLAENHKLPQEILAILCVDENPYVAHRAQSTARHRRTPCQGCDIPESDTLKVLIVDDDDVTRLILTLALKSDAKVKLVGQASCGEDAIKLAVEHQPDIVLMDIGMPGMNGIETTASLKTLSPLSKVIMVTAHDTVEEIVSAFGHGAEGYHLKSTPNHDLSKAIRVVASGSFWLDPGIASMVLREFSQKSVSILKNVCRSERELRSVDLSNPVELLLKSADEYAVAGQFGEARQICQSALSLAQNLFGEEATCTNKAMSKLAEFHYLEEEYGSSESTYLNLVKMQSRLGELEDPELEKYLLLLAEFYEFRANFEQAELFYSWLLRIREKCNDKEKISQTAIRLKEVMSKARRFN